MSEENPIPSQRKLDQAQRKPWGKALRRSGTMERTTLATARESWHVLGIMSEFVEASERLAEIRPAVSIFGSARLAPESDDYRATEAVARQLSDAGFAVISGGGPGVMEAANRGAFAGKSPSVGPQYRAAARTDRQLVSGRQSSFSALLRAQGGFRQICCCYVAMPGGFGTLDELTEALTLMQTGKTSRLPIILYGSKFWAGLLLWNAPGTTRAGFDWRSRHGSVYGLRQPEQVVDTIFAFYRAAQRHADRV